MEDIEVTLFDLNNTMNDIVNLVNQYYNATFDISNIVSLIEHNLQTITDSHVSNIDEYNKLNSDNKLLHRYVIINGLEKVLDDVNMITKLMYIHQMAEPMGINLVYALTSDRLLNNTILNYFDYRLILYNNFMVSERLLGFNHMGIINRNIEGFLKYRDLIIRICLLQHNIEIKRKKD